MFNVLIDTCVWLDIAQDTKQTPLLTVLEHMAENRLINLLVPRLVVDEFRRNRERVARTSARSLASHFQQVRDAVSRAGAEEARRNALLAELDEMNHRIPLIGGTATGALDRIERLFGNVRIIETPDAAKLRAADRALTRAAPCHHENKNSIADAVLIETYAILLAQSAARERYAFVTHNKNDFSVQNGNQRLPHPDIEGNFSRIKSLYFINLGDLLKKIDPELVEGLLFEETFEDQPRALADLLDAHERLTAQVWYNRHMVLQERIDDGRHRVVTQAEWDANPDTQGTTVDYIWEGAQAAARETERELGEGNYGPWDDFEWGMVNGKLSAIRWVLGDEWDMLDT